MAANPAHSQSPDQINQLQKIIEQQQRQLDKALRVIDEQRRMQEEQRQMQEEQAGKIEALEQEVRALRQPPDKRQSAIPPGIKGGPISPEDAEIILQNPGTINPQRGVDPDSTYSVSFGGHINRQASVADDGDDTKSYFVDSSNVPSYVFLKANADVNDDLTLGAHVEYAVQDNPSSQVNQNNETAGFSTSGRFLEVTANSKTYGKGSFGKGFGANFFLFDTDKSGTQYGNLLSVGNAFPGLLFNNEDTNELTDISVGSAFLDVEALSLINRVRYDSPMWKGLQLSASTGENQQNSVKLSFDQTYDSFDITAATSYQNNAQGADSRIDGGVGILHQSTGLNLSGGYARTEFDSNRSKADGFVVRPGWRTNFFNFGETKFAIDFTRAWDITQEGDRATSYGAFVMQDLDAYGMQFYTGYRNYDLNRDDVDLDEIQTFSAGVSVNFDARFTFDSDGALLR